MVTMQYILRSNAMALIPYFNDVGEVETIVLEQEQYVNVKEKPYSLIDSNLRYYGSSMRGAKDGVNALLGKTNMAPVPIQTATPMIWLPLKAIKDDTCVWINAHAIINTEEISSKETLIELLNGHTIQLDISKRKLLQRLYLAYVLMALLQIRSSYMEGIEKYCGKTFHFCRGLNQLNFELRSPVQY